MAIQVTQTNPAQAAANRAFDFQKDDKNGSLHVRTRPDSMVEQDYTFYPDGTFTFDSPERDVGLNLSGNGKIEGEKVVVDNMQQKLNGKSIVLDKNIFSASRERMQGVIANLMRLAPRFGWDLHTLEPVPVSQAPAPVAMGAAPLRRPYLQIQNSDNSQQAQPQKAVPAAPAQQTVAAQKQNTGWVAQPYQAFTNAPTTALEYDQDGWHGKALITSGRFISTEKDAFGNQFIIDSAVKNGKPELDAIKSYAANGARISFQMKDLTDDQKKSAPYKDIIAHAQKSMDAVFDRYNNRQSAVVAASGGTNGHLVTAERQPNGSVKTHITNEDGWSTTHTFTRQPDGTTVFTEDSTHDKTSKGDFVHSNGLIDKNGFAHVEYMAIKDSQTNTDRILQNGDDVRRVLDNKNKDVCQKYARGSIELAQTAYGEANSLLPPQAPAPRTAPPKTGWPKP